MRIARLLYDGAPEFAVDVGEGEWLPLSAAGLSIPDTATVASQLAEIRQAARAQGPTLADPTLLPPVVRPEKSIGIGLNYLDHIRETGLQAPDRPVVFAKFPNSYVGPRHDILVDPELTSQPDYEVELAVVIGKPARRVAVDRALDHVLGYCVANDVSARDWQRAEGQFSRSKSFDTFCPIGPWLTTADEVEDPQDLRLRSLVNGETRQESTTGEMIFTTAELISFLSQAITLAPGDVILTGTPHGVGFAMDPPRFLQPGDQVRCEIDGLGVLDNTVRHDAS